MLGVEEPGRYIELAMESFVTSLARLFTPVIEIQRERGRTWGNAG